MSLIFSTLATLAILGIAWEIIKMTFFVPSRPMNATPTKKDDRKCK